MTTITATLPNGAVETVDVDSIITESFDDSSAITDHPVEQGSDVSDNQRPEPEKLHLDLIVSNTPFGVIDSTVRAEAVHATLKAWRKAGALLSLTTTMGLRALMAIESIRLIRDSKTGGHVLAGTGSVGTGGVRIQLALKEIRLVQNKLTQITVSKRDPGRSIGNKTKTGAQPTNDPTSPAFILASTASAQFTKSSSGDAGPIGQSFQAIAAGAP